MKIEDKVVSLELTKRMEELGWRFETERYWVDYKHGNVKHLVRNSNLHMYPKEHWTIILAPDAIEIMERLPYKIKAKDKLTYYLEIHKWKDGSYSVRYHQYQDDCPEGYSLEDLSDRNLSEVSGEMWCYLTENKII